MPVRPLSHVIDAKLCEHHPGLEPLLGQTCLEISSADDPSCPLHCPEPGKLTASPLLIRDSLHLIELRYGLELAWLAGLPGLSQAAAAILAGHAASSFAATVPGLDAPRGPLATAFDDLASDQVTDPVLDRASEQLAGTHAGPPNLTSSDRLHIHALWRLAEPTECLLAAGGDDRLILNADGRNRYGCAPWPLPDVVSFGSCTASSLSPNAFATAERARQALAKASLASAPSAALAEASDAIATELLRYFRAEDLADCVLAASGTDAALVVTGLLAAEHPEERLTSILMSQSETGSGVPDAVQGRHFASSAPTGCRVGKGEQIDGLLSGPGLVTIGLRDAAGAPRPADEVARACEAAIRHGLAVGRVVLHAIEGSKTGLTAPDRATCRRLADMFGDRLDIVIDACQARIEPELSRWHLSQGFPLLVTGSKFFAAPGFCGAVLFPRQRLRRIASHGRLPAGLEPYARLQGGFGSRRCPGLILRWRAALHEMAAFAALAKDEASQRITRMGASVEAMLARHENLRLMPAPRPHGMGWSDRRSVFTFAIRTPQGWMNPAELRFFYNALGTDLSGSLAGFSAAVVCQIGQPVELGTTALGGLRIAFSAAQIAGGADHEARLATVLDKLLRLLAAKDIPVQTPPHQVVGSQGVRTRLTG